MSFLSFGCIVAKYSVNDSITPFTSLCGAVVGLTWLPMSNCSGIVASLSLSSSKDRRSST